MLIRLVSGVIRSFTAPTAASSFQLTDYSYPTLAQTPLFSSVLGLNSTTTWCVRSTSPSPDDSGRLSPPRSALIRQVLAEGLAETAVHSADTIGGLFPPSWPYPPIDDPLACFSLSPAPPASGGPSRTALEAYRDFVVDSDVVVKPYDPEKMIVRSANSLFRQRLG